MAMLTLRAFGALDLRDAEGAPLGSVLSQTKRLALLAYLLLSRPGELHRRDSLLALFWPEMDQERGRKALSQALSFLRKEVGEEVLLTRAVEEVGVASGRVRCDVLAFQEALKREDWAGALDLYRGDLLEGLHVKGAPEFVDWVDRERVRLREGAAGAAWRRAQQFIGEGKPVEAERTAQRALELVATDESPVRRFMEALARGGDRGAALRFYEKFKGVLERELGVEPAPETEALAQAVRNGVIRAEMPEGVETVGEGRSTGDQVSGEAGVVAEGEERVAAAPVPEPGGPPQGRRSWRRLTLSRGYREPRWGRVKAVVYSGAAVLGLTLVAVLAARRSPDPAAAPGAGMRIVVAWFDNHTGDETLGDVGSLAAEWVADGLSRQGVTRVIPASAVRELMRGELSQAADHSRRLADRTKATVLVTGRYDRRGDSLEYRAEVLELTSERVLGSIGPLRGAREETSALDDLVDQVFMVVETRRRTGSRVEWSRPRSLQAYREYMTGLSDHFLLARYRESIPFFHRAIALDSLWLSPRAWMMGALINLGDYRGADSVRVLAQVARERAPVVDQLGFDWLTAGYDGDHERQYRIGRRLLEMDSVYFLYYAAYPAANTGRAREVLRYAALRDTVLYWSREWRAWDGIHLWALHALGEFEEELALARQNVARRGLDAQTAVWMVRPLAAMGRSEAVDSLYERVRDMPDVQGFTAAGVPGDAGWEYLAHGHDEAPVRRMFQERLNHCLSRPPADQARFGLQIAQSYMMLGHLPEARALLDSISSAAPDNTSFLGQLGVVAALQGDTTAAREVMERLAVMEGPHLRGANTMWQGRIAGALGDCSRAAVLLRTALSRGQFVRDLSHHWYASLGKARECFNLQAVLAPRE
jgi:DNA-binding SARP family transcriptional activator/tetratricopeptide (TPR) repeat protein